MVAKVYVSPSNALSYRLGGWTLSLRANSLSRGEQKIELENRLVLLLVYLMDNAGQVLSKEQILKTIWQGKVVNEDSLAVAISHLRKALGDNPRNPEFIKTIPGVGYQFIAEATPVAEIKPASEEVASSDWVIATSSTAQNAVDPNAGATDGFVKQQSTATVFLRKGIVAVLVVILLSICAWQLLRLHQGSANSATNQQPLSLAQAQLLLDSWDDSRLRAAIQAFKKLLAANPNLGEAYAGIASAKIRLLKEAIAQPENCAEVISLLNKAISLTPDLASAYVDRGNSLFWCKRERALAGRDYLQAIALDANNAQAPMQYSQLLLAEGRFADSLAQLERSRQLDPLSFSVPTAVWIFQMNRRNDLAYAELERIGSTEGEGRFYHISMQRVLASLGREEESFIHWQWLMADAHFSDEDMADAQAQFTQGGLTAVNRWLLARKEPADLGQYSPPLSWARYALAAGELDTAMDYLAQAATIPQLPLLWMAVDPDYDPLRANPRFQAIQATMAKPLNALQ